MKLVRAFCVGVLLSSLAATQAVASNGGVVSGRVLDSDGNGIVAQVKAYQIQVKDGRAFLRPRCFVRSAGDGSYVCPGLPDGRYVLSESSQSSKAKGSDAREAVMTPIFFPGVSNLSDTEFIEVASGGATWADFHVPVASPLSVAGKLVPSASSAGFTLKADSEMFALDSGLPIQYDGKTGAFAVRGVAPGHYLLEADWLVEDSEHRAALTLDVGARSVSALRIEPLANVEIAGHLANAPSAGTTINEIRLVRADGMIPDQLLPLKNGEFRSPTVPSGNYIVELNDGVDGYVQSVAMNGKETEGSAFATSDQPIQTLEIKVHSPAMRLTGTVSAWSGPARTADVIAVSESDRTVHHVLTDEQRRFVISGLAPGSYRLYAWPGPDAVAYRNESVRKNYLNESTGVKISDGSINSDVTLQPIEKIK